MTRISWRYSVSINGLHCTPAAIKNLAIPPSPNTCLGAISYTESKRMDADYFLLQAAKISPSASLYVQALLISKRFTEQPYNACQGLLRLARSYGDERMEAACTRALRGRTYNQVNEYAFNYLNYFYN